jgi:hypothetical protein
MHFPNRMNRILRGVSHPALMMALFAMAPSWATAQEGVDTLRAQLRLPQPATFAVDARGRSVAPGMTIGVPSGFGAAYGDAFAAIAFQYQHREYHDVRDGGVAAGFGLGDPQRLLGIEVVATSFGTFRSCCRGALSLKAHRLLPGDVSAAVGVENAVIWGYSDSGLSLYAAATKILFPGQDPGSLFGTVALTGGVGNGRFRRNEDLAAERQTVNPFGSVGVRLAPKASAIATWTGQDLAAGVSIVPFPRVPLFITPAVADLTTRGRFMLGVGYGFSYGQYF